MKFALECKTVSVSGTKFAKNSKQWNNLIFLPSVVIQIYLLMFDVVMYLHIFFSFRFKLFHLLSICHKFIKLYYVFLKKFFTSFMIEEISSGTGRVIKRMPWCVRNICSIKLMEGTKTTIFFFHRRWRMTVDNSKF